MLDYTLIENQTTLKEQLHAKVMRVSFTKTNGERRDMECTLDPTKVPQTQGKETSTRSISSAALPVYDVNANGWRSFRWDSIIEVK